MTIPAKTTTLNKPISFSIVVETENLGMANLIDLEACLRSLEKQQFPIEKAEEVLLIVGGHLSKRSQDFIAKKYPWLSVYQAKENLVGARAKFVGAATAKGEFIVFADSDVRYTSTWLGNLLDVFMSNPQADVATGHTRVEIRSSYTFALNLAWVFHILPPFDQPKKDYPPFHVNNFAIRKQLMLRAFASGPPLLP